MLSIIISVYNVNKYIKQCIDSVLNLNIQTEILVVHDPQKDESFKGYEEYLENKKIKILDRTNAGLAMARNQGLEVALGDYVLFLDGDDYIIPEELNKLYTKAMEQRPEIIVGGYEDEGIIPYVEISEEEFLCTGKKFLNKYVVSVHSMVWRYLFRRDFLIDNNLFFERVKYCEDIIFTPLALYKASSIYYTNYIFYNYRKVSTSLSHDCNEQKVLDACRAFKVMYNYSENFDEISKKAIRKEANYCAALAIAYDLRENILKESKKIIVQEVLDNIYPTSISWKVFKIIRKMSKPLSEYILKSKYS